MNRTALTLLAHPDDAEMLCAGTKYAEAFIPHRGHAFPDNDLLKELFNPPEL